MGTLGMRHLQTHGRPGQARGVGRVELGRLGPGAHDPAAEFVAARRFDQGFRRNRPDEAAGLGRRRSPGGQRPIAPRTSQIDRVDLGFAPVPVTSLLGRRSRSDCRIDDRENHASHSRARRSRRFAAPDQTPQSRALAAGCRLPRRADFEDIGPFTARRGHAYAPSRRLATVGHNDLTLAGLMPPQDVAPSNRSQDGRRTDRDLGRLGPENVVGERHRDVGPRRDDPITRRARPDRSPANPTKDARH